MSKHFVYHCVCVFKLYYAEEGIISSRTIQIRQIINKYVLIKKRLNYSFLVIYLDKYRFDSEGVVWKYV